MMARGVLGGSLKTWLELNVECFVDAGDCVVQVCRTRGKANFGGHASHAYCADNACNKGHAEEEAEQRDVERTAQLWPVHDPVVSFKSRRPLDKAPETPAGQHHVVRYKGFMENVKWRYLRDDIGGLDELEEKLKHRGDLGWELVSIVHTTETKRPADENILAPEGWILIFKQPAA